MNAVLLNMGAVQKPPARRQEGRLSPQFNMMVLSRLLNEPAAGHSNMADGLLYSELYSLLHHSGCSIQGTKSAKLIL